jgi:hemolysin activation/secretion protein
VRHRCLNAHGITLGFSAIVAGLSVPAFAQQAASLPPTRDELRPVAPLPTDRAPRLSVEGDIERAPCPLADPSYVDVKVTISEVQFNNLKGASEAELRPTYAQYLGTQQPVSALCDIRDAAATYLRSKGYLAAVQVPAQRIENGVVRLEMLYARMTTLRVRGEAKGAEAQIEKYLGQLTKDEIFDRNRAERYLLLARDLPGYDVRLTLKPAGTGPGDLIGEVTVYRTPFELDATVQNLAAKDTGHWGGQVRAAMHGLTGMGDSTTVSLYSTADFREQQILQLGHEMRLGAEGLTLAGFFTYAWTKPDLNAAAGAPDLKARTLFASLEARYPFKRTLGTNINGAIGFDFVNQGVKFITPLSRDRLRVGFARVDFDAIDTKRPVSPAWRLSGSLEVRQGFDIFNASPNCRTGCPGGGLAPSRFDGQSDATVIRATGEAEVALGKMASFMLRPRAQLGSSSLLSFEEFAGGNYTVGRGYDPGTIIGDSGVGAQAELRGPRLSVSRSTKLMVQPYAFADAAWVWNKNNPGAGDPDRLVSVGAGVRADLSNRFRLDLALAIPTEKAGLQAKRGDPRVLLTLTTRLVPWGAR